MSKHNLVQVLINYIVMCVLIFNSSYGISAPNTDFIKDILLSKNNEIHTIRANYKINQTGIADGINSLNENHTIVLDGENYKITRQFESKTGNRIEVLSYKDGIYSTFLTGDHVKKPNRAAGIIGWKQRPIPDGAYLDPRYIWGVYQGRSITQLFEELTEQTVNIEDEYIVFQISVNGQIFPSSNRK